MVVGKERATLLKSQRFVRIVLGVSVSLAFLAPRAGAEERTLILRPDRTRVTFTLKATAHEVRGVLPVATGELRVDPATGAATGTVTIDARGATTGNSLRDREMHADVLESERFPVITFTATRLDGTVVDNGLSDVTLHGTVRIHGTEHALALPTKLRREAERIAAESSFDVPYVEWGLRDPSMLILRVAKVVSVTVKLDGNLH